MTSLSESMRECDSLVGSIFLTRSLLNHPSLMSLRTDEPPRDLRAHTHNLVTNPIRRSVSDRLVESSRTFALFEVSLFWVFALPLSPYSPTLGEFTRGRVPTYTDEPRRWTAVTGERVEQRSSEFLPQNGSHFLSDPRLSVSVTVRSVESRRSSPLRELCHHEGTRGASDETLRETADSRARFIYIRNPHA